MSQLLTQASASHCAPVISGYTQSVFWIRIQRTKLKAQQNPRAISSRKVMQGISAHADVAAENDNQEAG
jgi:hypothetical protein